MSHYPCPKMQDVSVFVTIPFGVIFLFIFRSKENKTSSHYLLSIYQLKHTAWIVGADNFEGPDGERNGYAKVYAYYDGDWAQKGSTIFGMNGERTGYAVAMSGDGNTVCVGDRWYEVIDVGRRGRARCFLWNGSDWNVKGTNYILGTAKDGEMGYSLSLNYDGTHVAVGNRFGGDDRQGSVAVYEFKKNSWRIMVCVKHDIYGARLCVFLYVLY